MLDGNVHGTVFDCHVGAGADAAAERPEVHVGGLDVQSHLVRVGERLAALWTLFVLLLLVHVEDVASEGLFACQHPEIKDIKTYTWTTKGYCCVFLN